MLARVGPLVAGAILWASLIGAQTAVAEDQKASVQSIAEKVKVISLFHRLNMNIMILGHIETQELLGAQVDWQKLDHEFFRNAHSITNITQDLESDLANIRREGARLRSMTDTESQALAEALELGATLIDLAYQTQAHIRDGDSRAAALLYLDESRPLIEAVGRFTYTAISNAERDIGKIALSAR